MNVRSRLAVIATLLVLLLLPATVQAHAELVRAEPAGGAVLDTSPLRVRLYFSEPIESDFFALEVYAADGTRVDLRDAHIPSDDVAGLEAGLPLLESGGYSVAWRILSIDGHVVQGTYSFSVGTPTTAVIAPPGVLQQGGAPAGLGPAARGMTYLLAFTLVGGLGFAPLILWPALRTAVADVELPAQRAKRGLLWVAWPAIVLVFALSLLALLLQASEVTGVPLGEVLSGHAISRLLTGTRYGAWWAARFALLAGLLAVVAVASVEARPRRTTRLIGLIFGAGLLLTIAGAGHASTVMDRGPMPVLAAWLHLIAGTVWIGGLIQLLTSLPLALRAIDSGERRALLAATVRRFSWLAGASVTVLVLTGAYASLLHVPAADALVDTPYGAALSGKLLLFLPLLALGAINLLVLHPRLVRAARPGGSESGSRLFRSIVAGEVVVAMLLLAVTGILAGLPPATTAPGAGEPFREIRSMGELEIALAISPNRAGDNRIELTLTGQEGSPAAVDSVSIMLGHQEMAMDERMIEAREAEPGRWVAEGNALNMAGRWAAMVEVRRPGAEPARAPFDVLVGQAPGAARPVFSPLLVLREALTPTAMVGGIALVVGLLLLGQSRRWRGARERQVGVALGVTLGLIGTFVAGDALATAYQATRPNPFPPTAESLAAGRTIYIASCASCHGPTGRGDGPLGVRLRPRPADFRIHMAAGHSDAQLFAWIADGVAGTGMPAFRGQLTADEIWHVANYIRSFAPPRQ